MSTAALTASGPALLAAALGALAGGTAPSPTKGSAREGPCPPDTLPPVEVRAAPLADPLGPLPISSRTIDRERVGRRPGGDLRDLLLPIAGVRVSSRAAPFAASTPTIRGSTAQQVLVLIDGRRWNPAQGGGADLASIPLDWVESVEVLRGSASAFWGSDALAGVIHVHTRGPRAGSARLRLGAGGLGERSAAGSLTLPGGRAWTGRLAARGFRASGKYAFLDDHRGTRGTRANGDITRLTGQIRAQGPGPGGMRVRVDALGLRSERGVPGSEEFPTPRARLEEGLGALGLRLEAVRGPSGAAYADLSILRRRHRYRDPEAPFGPLEESHRETDLEGDLSLVGLSGPLAWKGAAGIGIARLTSTTDGRRRRLSGNARLRASTDRRAGTHRLHLSAAARLDAIEGSAPFLSPRAGLSWEIRPARLEVRASSGLSFRAPSFDELFWPARATAAGNPNLRAERAADAQAGISVRGQGGGSALCAQAFTHRVRDLIQWVPGAEGVWRPHNVRAAELWGLEFEGEGELALRRSVRARLSASFTLLEARDRSGEPTVDGKRLTYRPRHSAAAALLLLCGERAELEGQFRWVGEVFVTRANTKSLPGYGLGDVRLRWHAGRGLAADIAVTNVTGTTARDFRDYPLPGRSWELGLTMFRGGGK